MRILIVSDTHRYTYNFEMALERVRPVDYIIHCGDVEHNDDYINMVAGCPVHMVAGNNDWGSALDREIITMIGSYRVLITHGHLYSVNYDLDRLEKIAHEKNIDIVIFGHTHIPLLEERNGIVFLNPGSISFPRQYGRIPTYAVMNMEKKEIKISIVEMDKEGVQILKSLDFKGKNE